MKKILIILSSFILCSCVSTKAPEDNSDFANLDNLHQLAGVYNNKGDPKGFLSHAIFTYSKSKDLQHENIKLIKVSVNGNIVDVKAIGNDCVLYEESFIYGVDFNIENNVIALKNDRSFLNNGEILGPGHSSFEIGIDQKGHGKSKFSQSVVGLYGLFLPVAAYESSEIKFARLNIDRNFNKCIPSD